MENKLIYFDLCCALSDIFVDNEIDFKYISSVAKNFPVDKVEEIFFEWVAPVCYTNLLSPTPTVWSGFDPNTLWFDICKYQNNKGFFAKFKHKLLVIILKKVYKNEWTILKDEMLMHYPGIKH